MKFLIVILFIFSNLYAQKDTIKFILDYEKYNIVARNNLYKDYEEVIKNGYKDSYRRKKFPPRMYWVDELQTISIPVFWFNENAKDYRCGDQVEYIINFIEDPYFQEVCVTKDNEQVTLLQVMYTDEERQRICDSLKDEYLFAWNSFINSDDDYIAKNIGEYIRDNPDALVFRVKDITGYWVIKNGRLLKLVEGCFIGFCKIFEKNASWYLSKFYGEDLVQDIVNGGMRIGRRYYGCRGEFRYKDLSKVFIKAEIKREK